MRHRRTLVLILADIISVIASYALALELMAHKLNYIMKWENIFFKYMIVIILIKVLTYSLFKLYGSLWEYASIDEMMEIVIATISGNILAILILILGNVNLPRSIHLVTMVLDVAFIGASRFCFRVFARLRYVIAGLKNDKKVLIVGAGAAGVMVLNELRNHDNLRSRSIFFLDDNPNKKGKYINRVAVLGDRNDIEKVCKKYNINEIIIAMPSAKPQDRKEILNICKKTKCKTRILPGVYELMDGKLDAKKIRDVQIEDLLGRDEIKLDMEGLSSFISGRRILVTGGGGSIGSELCRQIARFKPKELIILEIYENNAYDIQNELLRTYSRLNLRIYIASIRDKLRVEEIFKESKPEIVFHAAAHKHVPLMESNPKAAIKNNVFGTLNVVEAADKFGVEKFVMISTDKAVNPTNIMGASKRVCEMIIQSYNSISKTDYVAVRFGNVLGSNGSVIPLFKRQIAEGGPVTVTDEKIIRYFMTIPEACQLVLQSGSMAKGGEIFVLDMGEPVKIINLARDLIRLSGYEPGVDIQIEITGLRPGEKLYEELLLDPDTMKDTTHNKIFVENPREFDYRKLMRQIEEFNYAIASNNPRLIKLILLKIVPTYMPNDKDLTYEELDSIWEEEGLKLVKPLRMADN